MFRASVVQRDEKAKVVNRQTWVVIRQERSEMDRNIHAHCVLPTKRLSNDDLSPSNDDLAHSFYTAETRVV